MAKTTYKTELTKLFASFAVILMCVLIFINSFLISGIAFDISTAIYALKVSIPAGIVMGFIGHLTGSILDRKPRKVRENVQNVIHVPATEQNTQENEVEEQKEEEKSEGASDV